MRGIVISRNPRFAAHVISALLRADVSVFHISVIDEHVEFSGSDFVVLDIDAADVAELAACGANGMLGNLPRIACGNRDQLATIRELLDRGVDDFLLKPVDADELRTRIALLAANDRSTRDRQAVVEAYGGLTFDQVSRFVTYRGRAIDLTPRERSVLLVLLRHREQIVSKERLAAQLFLGTEEIGNAAIETYIHRVRRKLSTTTIRIETLRGLGYRLSLAQVESSSA